MATIKEKIDDVINLIKEDEKPELWIIYLLENIEIIFGIERLQEIHKMIDERFEYGGW